MIARGIQRISQKLTYNQINNIKTNNLYGFIVIAGALLCSCTSQISQQEQMLLRDNWTIQSSKAVAEDGKTISMPDFKPEK